MPTVKNPQNPMLAMIYYHFVAFRSIHNVVRVQCKKDCINLDSVRHHVWLSDASLYIFQCTNF